MIWSNNPNLLLACLFLSLFLGILMDMLLAKMIHKEYIPKVALISTCITLVFLSVGGYTIGTVANILLCQILLYASVWDIATHTVPDYVHILLAIVGVVGFEFLPAMVGFIVVGLPLFIAAMVSEDKIGGGDVKLMAILGFAIGVNRGFTTLILGLFFAVIFGIYFSRIKKHNEPLALIPYFSLGCALALL